MNHDSGRFLDNLRITILFSFIFFVWCTANSQSLNGLYRMDSIQFVKFSPNHNIDFKLTQSTCFGDWIEMGYGNYKLRGNKIVINTSNSDFKSTLSSYEFIPDSNKRDIEIIISNTLSIPISGAYVLCNTKNNKSGLVSDSNGLVNFPIERIPKDSVLLITYLGFQPLKIKLRNIYKGVYYIKLTEGNCSIIEDRKIKFFYRMEEDTLFIRSKNNLDYYTFLKVQD